ncbi:patatin-like phospholipase family protein [Roseateles violae]|uniref:Patatin-like phospholipase family protein n=1 Tax=Roseateles violae TaxID=3058042 RepID=A0ABT8DW07_9BURK|nr:patatin-like phospholipase family protein [Pelomonas sp. PFR6]MDN3921223.1 patatin-like phospholipase family protein [Pelomonas sp. PFR6]
MPIFAGPKHRLNLALQGGGAHGAFTWGVLDALLEDGRLDFEGVSGTSAGAMNAVLLAQGLMDGGADGARAALRRFWTAVAAAVPEAMTRSSADGQSVGLAPMVQLLLHWTHYLSPQQINPFDLNPLRDIIEAQVDFARLRRASPLKLFIAATRANSGKLRIFRTEELSCEALLASACLPSIQRAVEIDGEPYWDGGYTANPAVFPLFYECRSRDLLLVLLSPLRHRGRLSSAQDIQARVMEIAFSAGFLREMRMFAQLRRQLVQRRGWLGLPLLGRFEHRVRHSRFHLIEAADVLGDFSAQTKLAVNLKFFEHLMLQGRARGRAWLDVHFAAVGRRSTVDLEALFA